VRPQLFCAHDFCQSVLCASGQLHFRYDFPKNLGNGWTSWASRVALKSASEEGDVRRRAAVFPLGKNLDFKKFIKSLKDLDVHHGIQAISGFHTTPKLQRSYNSYET
jgi:hypothetical protein